MRRISDTTKKLFENILVLLMKHKLIFLDFVSNFNVDYDDGGVDEKSPYGDLIN